MKRMNLSSDGKSAKGNFRGRWFESNSFTLFIFLSKSKGGYFK